MENAPNAHPASHYFPIIHANNAQVTAENVTQWPLINVFWNVTEHRINLMDNVTHVLIRAKHAYQIRFVSLA